MTGLLRQLKGYHAMPISSCAACLCTWHRAMQHRMSREEVYLDGGVCQELARLHQLRKHCVQEVLQRPAIGRQRKQQRPRHMQRRAVAPANLRDRLATV